MDDKALIEAVRAGNRDAYGVLVERYQAAIVRRCCQMTGNMADAEELAHQAFVEGYIKLHQLRDAAKFLPWLRTLTLNLCRGWYRERQKRPLALPDDDQVVASSPEEESADDAQIAWGLSRLSESHRVILVLRYFEKLSYEEVAQFLDIPIGTAMSRIHRAHRALKDILEQAAEGGEMDSTISSKDFRKEVEAEIAVLLDMCGEDADALEKLALVLRRSPGRFGQLLHETHDATMIENLACLLPHLGKDALRTAVHIALHPDADTGNTAATMLAAYVARCRSPLYSGSYGHHGMPPRKAYYLVEAILDAPDAPDAKAALLLRLVRAAADDGAAALLTGALLCFPDAAFRLLSEQFWGAETFDEHHESWGVLHLLCRMPKRFSESLCHRVNAADSHTLVAALTGIQAIGRAFERAEIIDARTPQHFAHARHITRKWSPLRREELDDAAYQALIDGAARLMDHESAAVREAALCAVGKLKAAHLCKRVESFVAHPDAATRKAAILALGDIGDLACVDGLMHAAASGDASERRSAVQALSRFRTERARELFVRCLDDADTEVRCAAILALGDLGLEAAKPTLTPLLRAQNTQVRKAAAKVLMSKEPPVRTTTTFEEDRRERVGTPIGQAFTYRSLDAAMRFSLPEERAYGHWEITQRLSQVCIDFSTARRHLITEGLMVRENDIYEFTDLGRTVWRIEHFIMDHS